MLVSAISRCGCLECTHMDSRLSLTSTGNECAGDVHIERMHEGDVDTTQSNVISKVTQLH